jgi:Zn-dependent protease with chaperone function
LFEAIEALGQVIARLAMRLLRLFVGLIYDAEHSLMFRSTQRAEYYADALGARIGSSAAMVRCLDKLHLARLCSQSVDYAARRGQADIWSTETQFFDELGEREWERLRRLDARRGTSIDTTHPPTDLRIQMVESMPGHSAQVTLSADEFKPIAAEIASAFQLVSEQLVSRLAV